MSPPSPDQVGLTEQQRHDLQQLARAGRTQQRLAQRAHRRPEIARMIKEMLQRKDPSAVRKA